MMAVVPQIRVFFGSGPTAAHARQLKAGSFEREQPMILAAARPVPEGH
jgi:hypothetical protein